jgi:hypothetical protein
MPAPAQTPRLATLLPLTLARDAEVQLIAHVRRVCRHSSPVQVDGTYYDVRSLVGYAQRGTGPGDETFPTHDAAACAIERVGRGLYSCAAEPPPSPFTPFDPEPLDLRTPIGLVLVAANARVQIASGKPVTAKALGALAGLDEHHVRRLLVEAKIAPMNQKRPRRYRVARAVPWLAARVPLGIRLDVGT